MKQLKAYLDKNMLEAGCDEAGRGCLAGPVVASAVILNPKKKIAMSPLHLIPMQLPLLHSKWHKMAHRLPMQ